MQNAEERNDEYSVVLVNALHKCAIRFPQVVSSVVQMLFECSVDRDSDAAVIILFLFIYF